jgi:hypothetical protein
MSFARTFLVVVLVAGAAPAVASTSIYSATVPPFDGRSGVEPAAPKTEGRHAPSAVAGSTARLFAHRWAPTPELVELDPRTFDVLGVLPAPEPNSQGDVGLAYDGRSLFFLSGPAGGGSSMLYELDPDTGAVLDADPVPAGTGSFDGLACLAGWIYVLDYSFWDIYVFDPRTDTVVNTLDIDAINPGVQPYGGLAGIRHPAALIATDLNGTIYEIDPVTGVAITVVATGSFNSAIGVIDGLIYAGQALTGSGTEYQVYTRAGAPLRTVSSPFSHSGFAADDAVLGRLFGFPRDAIADLIEIDPLTGAELRRFPAPEDNTVSPGGDVGLAFDGRSLFFVSGPAGGGTSTLFELDPETGAVRDADPVAAGTGDFDGLGALGGLVWIQDYSASDIHAFDPVSDTVIRTLDIDAINPSIGPTGGLTGRKHPNQLVCTDSSGAAFGIDPITGVAASIVGSGPFDAGLAVVDGLLGAGEFSAGSGTELEWFDSAGRSLIALPEPYGYAALGGDDAFLGRMFVYPRDFTFTIAEIDPLTGVELGRIPAPESNTAGDVGLAFDGRTLYFVSGGAGPGGSGALYELDPDTGAVLDVDPAPASTSTDALDGIAVLGGLVYLLDYEESDIHIYDPQFNVPVGVLNIDVINPGVTLVGGLAAIHSPAALLAIHSGSTLYEIDPVSGVVTGLIPISGSLTAAVAVIDGLIYIGDLDQGSGTEIGVYTRGGGLLRSFPAPYGFGAFAGDDTTFQPRPEIIFADDFESGDTSAWSRTAP